MTSRDTEVLVVGGGVAGLSAALFLAQRGVRTTLVERHESRSLHPRAAGFTPRTIELLRGVGLDAQIPQLHASAAVFAGAGRPRRVRVESLAGRWFDELTDGTARATERAKVELSPVGPAKLSQDGLEPIIVARAAELGAELCMGTTLLGFEQDESGVTAFLRPRSGPDHSVRARYLVAADGNESPIREALGIARSGRGFMRTVRSVLFRAQLDEYLQSNMSQFIVQQPGFDAFLTTYRDGRWLLIFTDDRERDEATCLRLVYQAIGRDDVPVSLITTGAWKMTAFIADRFQSGRVFLVGDAAHTLPPARGGYGANTGIADAHNLAWKLEAVLRGTSTPALLDTYDDERRPVAWQRHDQIFNGEDYKAEAAGLVREVPLFDPEAMEFGQLYRSAAVIGAGPHLPDARRPDEWCGQPGTRAPHLWLELDGERSSTLDLFGAGWVVLTDDPSWKLEAAEAGARLGIEVTCVVVGSAVGSDRGAAVGSDAYVEALDTFRDAFGLRMGGAALIRPDGYVAWRAVERALPTEGLLEALRRAASTRG